MPIPDAKNHNPDTAYLQSLLTRINRPNTWVAKRIGISLRQLQYLIAGERKTPYGAKPVLMTYPEQFALERLAAACESLSK